MTLGRNRTGAWAKASITIVSALGLWLPGVPGIGVDAAAASAEDSGDMRILKQHWQDRYRALRLREARLEKTIDLATKEYADANRRNYRRSGVRHFHRTNAALAKNELAKVQKDLETIYDEARAADVPLIWLYEVEDETIDPDEVEGLGDYADGGRFFGPSDAAEDEDASEDDGRNPLYSRDSEDEAPPAGYGESGTIEFDYEAWQEDRGKYEAQRGGEEPSE